MLYKEYDEKTLHRLQQIELEILRDFDELCTENMTTLMSVFCARTMRNSCVSPDRKNGGENTRSSMPLPWRIIHS